MTYEELQQKFAREDAEARRAAMESLLAAKPGRKLLWWLLQIGGGGLGAQPFNRDALAMAFGCGQIQVGNQILAEMIEASPDGFVALMKEMDNERRERDRELDRAPRGGDDPFV